MSEGLRVFVNERAITVGLGTTVRDAVAECDAALADALPSGVAYVTDGVGRPIDPESLVEAGAILRVVRSARRTPMQQETS
jgi:hypothetical protein